jgi:AcrR family transcriptional regulator
MPRQPDPELEARILEAADALWRRGGEKALTMRAVAKAARTNTPAVYRRFKDREHLIRGLLLRIVKRIREQFERGETVQGITEAYVDYALKSPNEYMLFYTYSRILSPRGKQRKPRPIRDTRPNFALAEQVLARELGGSPEDHTQTVLGMWALLHGTSMLLLTKSIPEGHEQELREACRATVRALIANARKQKLKS